jgi:hypothetical protein
LAVTSGRPYFHQAKIIGLGQTEDRRNPRAAPKKAEGENMKPQLAALLLSGAFITPGGTTLAHHSFAMFDAAHPIEISGTVKEFNFIIPHVMLIVEVRGPSSVPTSHRTHENVPVSL